MINNSQKIKKKSLSLGLGGNKEVKKYYDNLSNNYDDTLKKWKYLAPNKACKVLKRNIKTSPKLSLDLGCGTGLFALELKNLFPDIKVTGTDFSLKSLKIARIKKIYENLFFHNFDKNFPLDVKYDLVSCIGAMTYVKSLNNFFINVNNVTKKSGFFIFTHRIDIWKKQKFLTVLKELNQKWKIIFISRPLNYLPKNKEFTYKIKIKIVLLQKL